MEKYDYEIEYVKGKENKVADSLSRLFPLTDIIEKAEAGLSQDEDMDEDWLDELTDWA